MGAGITNGPRFLNAINFEWAVRTRTRSHLAKKYIYILYKKYIYNKKNIYTFSSSETIPQNIILEQILKTIEDLHVYPTHPRSRRHEKWGRVDDRENALVWARIICTSAKTSPYKIIFCLKNNSFYCSFFQLFQFRNSAKTGMCPICEVLRLQCTTGSGRIIMNINWDC